MTIYNLLSFLLELTLILSMTSIVSFWLRKYRQPVVTAELLVGIALGPTILGRYMPEWYTLLFPAPTVKIMSLYVVVGAFLLMTGAGFEADFKALWKRRWQVVLLILSGIALPTACGCALVYGLPEQWRASETNTLTTAMMVSLVLSMSALPVTIRILRELGVLQTEIGGIIVSSLTLKNLVCWMLFALLSAHATRQNIKSCTSADTSLLQLLIPICIVLLILCAFKKRFTLVRVYSLVVLSGIAGGIVADWVGITPVVGFFAGGVIAKVLAGAGELPQSKAFMLLQQLTIPVYFVNIGMSTDFLKSFNVFLAILVSIAGILSRFTGAWLVVRQKVIMQREHLLFAAAFMPGGMMQVVMALAAYETGLISMQFFSALITGAVVSMVISGPVLAYVNSIGSGENLKKEHASKKA